MRIVEIAALENRAHRNQTGNFSVVPEGWAVIPNDMICESFPFGSLTAEEVDGVMTVTRWSAGIMPEPEPIPEPEPSVDERVTALEETTTEMAAAIVAGVNDI